MRRQRLHEGSKGQGVIEVLGVFGLFGALVAVGVPAFFGYQDGKADRQAREQLLAAVPAVESYRAKRGSYSGLDTVDLMRIDPRISPTLVVAGARGGRYCLTESVNGRIWSVAGPVRAKARFTAKPGCGRS